MGDLLSERDSHSPGSLSRTSSVEVDATPEEIRDTARRTGHLRLLVLDGETAVGVVHARDSIAAPEGSTAREIMRPSLSLDEGMSVAEAFRRMREARAHLVVVEKSGDPDVHVVRGVVTLDDVVRRLLPADY